MSSPLRDTHSVVVGRGEEPLPHPGGMRASSSAWWLERPEELR
jgi:hypothetical protein